MLKIITWNIQCARTASGAADLELVARCLRQAGDVDIVLLQELACGLPGRDGAVLGDQFTALAGLLPAFRAVSALGLEMPSGDGPARGMGCMSLSRHPILQVRRHALPWPSDPAPEAERMSMPRIVLEIIVATPQGPLRVLNTHLEYFSLRQRLAQIERLREIQAEAGERARGRTESAQGAGGPAAAIPQPAAAFLAGDFNLLPGSECHERLLAPGADGKPSWQDAWMLAHPGRPHAPTVGLNDRSPGAQAFTFDYACVSPALADGVRGVRVLGPDALAGDPERRLASDHAPLMVELA